MKRIITLLFLAICSVLSDGINELSQSNNLFAASVYKEILKKNETNFLVSPFSAEIVLTLAQSGARGETLQELQSALHLSNNQEKILSDAKALLSSMKGNENYTLHVAKKIYIQKDHPLKQEFEKVATDVFYSDLENIDFGQNVAAAQAINKWVEDHTENKIQNLINEDSIDGFTRAVLINALYFQANWNKNFKSRFTRKRKFYENGKNEIKVLTMQDFFGNYKYCENSELDAKFLEVPFKEQDSSMTFVLPNQNEGLQSLEANIDKVFLPQTYTRENLTVILPKFKIESDLDFKKILQDLGVSKAFIDGVADFSGISDTKLSIDEVIQKTFIVIGEEGVEAAAATRAGFSWRSGHLVLPTCSKQFIVDHPFLFYIKIKDTIIFAGRVSSPKIE